MFRCHGSGKYELLDGVNTTSSFQTSITSPLKANCGSPGQIECRTLPTCWDLNVDVMSGSSCSSPVGFGARLRECDPRSIWFCVLVVRNKRRRGHDAITNSAYELQPWIGRPPLHVTSLHSPCRRMPTHADAHIGSRRVLG